MHACPVRGAALPSGQQHCLRGRPTLPRHLPAVERGPRHSRGSRQGVSQPERPAPGHGAAGECGQRCLSYARAPCSVLRCQAAESGGTAVERVSCDKIPNLKLYLRLDLLDSCRNSGIFEWETPCCVRGSCLPRHRSHRAEGT